jgi:hypothetical protein
MSEWNSNSGVDQKKAEAMQRGVTKDTPDWAKKVGSFFSDNKETSNEAKQEALKRRQASYGS